MNTIIDLTSPTGGVVALPNQVLVGAASDLPAPSAGDITLAADTEYLFTGDVSIGTDRLVLSDNTVVVALDSAIATLTYTGTGVMFTSTGNSNKIARITISCANGTLFSIDGQGTGVFQLFDMTIAVVSTIGTWTALSSQITNVAFGSITTDGLLFAGAHGIFLGTGDLFTITAGTLLDLGTATFDSFTFTSSFPDVGASATMLSGATGSANVNAGGFATLQDILMVGAGTPLSGISADDTQWQFVINSTISDTMPHSLISFNTPTTTTAAQNTPTLIVGTWTDEDKSQFTNTAAGRITYNGVKDITVAISIATSIEAASGSNKDITVYLALNGTEITNSGSPNRVSSNDPKNTSVMWELDIVEDDFMEVFIENNTDGVGLTVNKASMRID